MGVVFLNPVPFVSWQASVDQRLRSRAKKACATSVGRPTDFGVY